MRGAGRDGCHIGICVALIQHIRPCYADKSNCGGIKRQFRERCLHLLNHLFDKVRYMVGGGGGQSFTILKKSL